ncbi:MAG: sigma-54-dependent Fis family transcriptional regulator [Deltaproteobacteria bacterium]|nr:sigma-54-dependent Fis family transcriptional regulator [Deltaproteobacteria bacterium]
MSKDRIVVVDDERDMVDLLEIMLRKEGYEVAAFQSSVDALGWCGSNSFDLVITDIKMPGMGGLEFLKSLKAVQPDSPVIMITAYASVDTAVEAMKAGAYDYFIKPFNVEEIKLNIRKAISYKNLSRENMLLKREIKERSGINNLMGGSPLMADVYSLIMTVANTKANILITGESGTGKELAARAIHYESDRKDMPFVAINCGAIPESLLESELFGHQKGAFTGAVSNKEGLAESADRGTLFLDEVTELPFGLQVKLLRFIQERSFRRVGGTSDIAVDIRLIAATNKDIEAEVKEGRFREDLFYRLNVIRIPMPRLLERKEDIPLLVRHFTAKYSSALGKGISGISEDAMKLLVDYDYPGNVRELENIIERAAALEAADFITPGSLPEKLRDRGRAAADAAPMPAIERYLGAGSEAGRIDLEKTVEQFEKAMLREALKKAGGVKKKAAELLGLSFRSMRYKLSKYDIPED